MKGVNEMKEMKAFTVYWSRPLVDEDDKNKHGSTTVVGSDITASIIMFADKYPHRRISSISSETDDVLFDITLVK